jgi:glycosyltransferase involved in cell wall biosynthesis
VEHLDRVDGLSVDLLAVNPRFGGFIGRLQSIKYVRTVLTTAAYVALLLRRVRHYDVIHVFSASYWSFLLAPVPAMLVGRLYGKKVVLNYHSGEAQDHLERSRLAARLIGLAHEVIVPSRYLVEVFAQFGITARAIFNFVDVERIPYRRRAQFAPRILTNRNLEPMYNVGLALRAFARIQAEIPEASLVVAGFGSQRESLEALAASLQLQRTTFVGRVPAEDMGSLYHKADLFINASNIDNMPLSLLDAFAAGVPVVTTDAGGIPYMVDNDRTGLVVPKEDDTALAAAALQLLRDDELAARIADAARAECIAHYIWPAVGQQWVSLYTGMFSRGAPPAQRSRLEPAQATKT